MFRRSQLLTLRVVLLDETALDVTVKDTTTGQSLLNAVCQQINIREVEYFGIKFLSNDQVSCWLNLKSVLWKQISHTSTVYFAVKFFLQDPNKLLDEVTRYHVVQQVRRALRQGLLPVNQQDKLPKIYALLAQSEFGDYCPSAHQSGYLSQICDRETEPEVVVQHKKLAGRQPSDVESMFLDEVKWLPLYGAELYSVISDEDVNSSMFLAVLPAGLVALKHREFKEVFYWPRIRKVYRQGCAVRMRVRDRDNRSQTHSFSLISKTAARQLLDYIDDYLSFLRRREKLGGVLDVRRALVGHEGVVPPTPTSRLRDRLPDPSMLSQSQIDLSATRHDDDETYVTAQRQTSGLPLYNSMRGSRSTNWLNKIGDNGLFSGGAAPHDALASLKFKHHSAVNVNHEEDYESALRICASHYGRRPQPPDPLMKHMSVTPGSHRARQNRVSFKLPDKRSADSTPNLSIGDENPFCDIYNFPSHHQLEATEDTYGNQLAKESPRQQSERHTSKYDQNFHDDGTGAPHQFQRTAVTMNYHRTQLLRHPSKTPAKPSPPPDLIPDGQARYAEYTTEYASNGFNSYSLSTTDYPSCDVITHV